MRTRWFWITVLLTFSLEIPSYAQDLIRLYQEAQFKKQAEQIFSDRGMRAQAMPPALIPMTSEAVRHTLRAFYPEPETLVVEIEPQFEATEWRLMRRLERGWYQNRFKDTPWTYLGNEQFGVLDTTLTRVLRGRLEAEFGPPTRTIVEDTPDERMGVDDFVQFEYWIVVNDTIPIKLLDVNGPFDRGLVIVGDRRQRQILIDVKEALAKKVGPGTRIDPYVDYFFDVTDRSWYRTGYTGSEFFTRRITRPTSYSRPRQDSRP